MFGVCLDVLFVRTTTNEQKGCESRKSGFTPKHSSKRVAWPPCGGRVLRSACAACSHAERNRVGPTPAAYSDFLAIAVTTPSSLSVPPFCCWFSGPCVNSRTMFSRSQSDLKSFSHVEALSSLKLKIGRPWSRNNELTEARAPAVSCEVVWTSRRTMTAPLATSLKAIRNRAPSLAGTGTGPKMSTPTLAPACGSCRGDLPARSTSRPEGPGGLRGPRRIPPMRQASQSTRFVGAFVRTSIEKCSNPPDRARAKMLFLLMWPSLWCACCSAASFTVWRPGPFSSFASFASSNWSRISTSSGYLAIVTAVARSSACSRSKLVVRCRLALVRRVV